MKASVDFAMNIDGTFNEPSFDGFELSRTKSTG
jgi:hypothetical protein